MAGKAGTYYAHSIAGKPPEAWQPLEVHLRNVGAASAHTCIKNLDNKAINHLHRVALTCFGCDAVEDRRMRNESE